MALAQPATESAVLIINEFLRKAEFVPDLTAARLIKQVKSTAKHDSFAMHLSIAKIKTSTRDGKSHINYFDTVCRYAHNDRQRAHAVLAHAASLATHDLIDEAVSIARSNVDICIENCPAYSTTVLLGLNLLNLLAEKINSIESSLEDEKNFNDLFVLNRPRLDSIKKLCNRIVKENLDEKHFIEMQKLVLSTIRKKFEFNAPENYYFGDDGSVSISYPVPGSSEEVTDLYFEIADHVTEQIPEEYWSIVSYGCETVNVD